MDEHLKALQDTLKAAADDNRNAIIRPKEAREGAEAIQRTVDEAFDKDAQSNQSKIDAHVMHGPRRIDPFEAPVNMDAVRAVERMADWARQSGLNVYGGTANSITLKKGRGKQLAWKDV